MILDHILKRDLLGPCPPLAETELTAHFIFKIKHTPNAIRYWLGSQ